MGLVSAVHLKLYVDGYINKALQQRTHQAHTALNKALHAAPLLPFLHLYRLAARKIAIEQRADGGDGFRREYRQAHFQIEVKTAHIHVHRAEEREAAVNHYRLGV